jgi:hypothetical protein
MKNEIEKLAHELEPIVDRAGIAQVLDALALLADLKASHVAEAWSDRGLERAWIRISGRLETVAKAAAAERL